MTKFAEVEMPITTPGDKAALALLRELDRRAQETAKNSTSAVGHSMATIQTHAAKSAREIAGNVAMIAAAGEATAGSLKGILAQGANIAFMFGASGAIGGAIALTGLAIFNLFTRTRQQIEETAQKAREELEKLQRSGDLGGVSAQASILQSGDPLAAVFGKHKDETDREFEKRRLGLAGVQAQMQAIARRFQTGDVGKDADKLSAEFQRLKELEKELTDQRNLALGVVLKLSAAEDERARNALNRMREMTEKERGGLINELTGGFRPEAGLLGKPMRAANEIDLSEGLLNSIKARLKKTPTIPVEELTPDLQRILNFEHLADSIGNEFGNTLAEGISNGISAGIKGGGIAGGFRALAGTVLQGIGGMLEQVGVAALAGLKLIATIKEAIAGFAPELGIPAAIGLIALGAVLQSTGGAMASHGGGSSGGGSSYGAGAGTGQTIIDRGLINPANGVVTSPGSIQARPNVIFAPTIIGTHDAKAQRDLVEMVRIGLTRSGESFRG